MKAWALVLLMMVAAAAAVVLRPAGVARGAPAPWWLVVGSDRDGGEYTLDEGQTYVLRPDGSRLTSLLGTESRLTPLDVSGNGRAIAYKNAEATGAVYVSRANGAGLVRVLGPNNDERLGGAGLSPDGTRVAITRADPNDHPRLLVVDADGRHVHSLGRADSPEWSRDGRLLTFATSKGCAFAAEPFAKAQARIRRACGHPRFSPDARFVAFQTRGRCAVVRTPAVSWFQRTLRTLDTDRPVFLGPLCAGPQWSPDGRWIAYQSPGCEFCDSDRARRAALKLVGVWIVRPDGTGRRRVGPADEEGGATYSWSPDSTRLAITTGSKVVVVALDGRKPRMIRLTSACRCDSYSRLLWSPDGRRLMLAAQTGEDPAQIWSARADGTGLRRITSAGVNDLIGVVRVAPGRAPARPLAHSERVLGPTLLMTSKPIGRLAADGGSVAYVAGSTETDCEHVSVWTPSAAKIQRVWPRLPAPCYDEYSTESSVYELALAGPMVGWSLNLGCGNSGCGVDTHTAELPKAEPRYVDEDDGTDYGNDFLRPFDPVGSGDVFAVESHVRIALSGGGVRRCELPGHQDAESVAGHKLAVRTERGELVVDDHCAVVSRIPLDTKGLKAVLLDGSRLVAVRRGVLDVYDVAGGTLIAQRSVPAGTTLDGAAGGVVAFHRATIVTALRLDDGRSISFQLCHGPVGAAVSRLGLYYTYTTREREGRLALVPRRELERRLGAGRSYQPQCLRSAEHFSSGGGPTAVAAGDFDGDGRPDLVTANVSGSISVLLRRDHAFGARHDYRVGGDPDDVAVADLDRDGHLDVAASLPGVNAVAILLNRGDGSFEPPRRYRAGHAPSPLVAGDLNADGAPDLVVASGTDKAITVLLNRGNGTFVHKTTRTPGDYEPSNPVIADLTGDGRPDLVFGHSAITAKVTVLVGAGDGTFPDARGYATGEEASAVAVADLNRNGRPDIAVVSGCGVSVLLDRAGGGFGPPRELPHREDCPREIAAGDLDGDGRVDLVTVATPPGFPASLSVFLNRGHGRFAAAGSYEAGGSGIGAVDLAIHDLDGDGKADLLFASSDRAFVSVLTNTLGVCRVHGLSGKSPGAERRILARAGCRIGRVSRVHSKRVSRGRVLAAEPRFGAFWPNGPEVDLIVSLGRRR
jgi:Tol biopolymer transport system component